MNDNVRFDQRRSEAWRAGIVEHAMTSSARDRGGRRALIVALVVAALAVSGGGVAFALSAHLQQPAVVASATPTPIERDTPSVTFTPTPSPSENSAATARQNAEQACRSLASALDSNGNIVSAEAWSAALESARQSAAAAAEGSRSFAGLDTDVSKLSQTALPGPSATDAEKNAYFDAYRPVAGECSSLGVALPSD
ncbi:MAG: hypothetical protein J0I18_18095 [Actinobacteria bacterium]|nr:hypothetical protein [Actinomycetota bacterium]